MVYTLRHLRIYSVIAAAFFLLINGCKKEEETVVVPVVPQTDSITDIDGNVYTIVKIGNQWWMAEDLRVTMYRDSTFIFEAQADFDWIPNTTGARCVFGNNPDAAGLLYNWYAVSNVKNIAPPGWHVPSDDEWKELEKHLGMSQADADKFGWRGTHEGEKLRIKSPEVWKTYSDVWSTNESGFTALAGGCRIFSGEFSIPLDFGSMGFWWTSTNHGDNDAYYRYLDYKNANVYRSHVSKNYGCSIRLVKD
ncbi:MAG TPA: fibrobacter succinogenes major paralogous domain-containing protein [Bacteroidia bacterium]|nr:fibrobacter succinogenes major paralogous domain-containing protein [Bacteroidia bacterium]